MRGYTPIPHHLLPNLMKTVCSYLLFTALGLATLGCGDKKGDSPAPSRTDLLTDRNWITTAFTVSPGLAIPGGATITDIYAQPPPCDRDDFVRFEKPNVFKRDEGANKCTQSDPQTTTGTWVFNQDQSIVTVTEQGSSAESYNITELTDTSLKFTFSEAFGTPVINYTYTVTCRKG